MTQAKHTREPWVASTWIGEDGKPFQHIGSDAHGSIARTFTNYSDTSDGVPTGNNHGADGQRIVACVNACEGINPEAVPDLVAALEYTVDWKPAGADPGSWNPENARDKARAALAKAKGGA